MSSKVQKKPVAPVGKSPARPAPPATKKSTLSAKKTPAPPAEPSSEDDDEDVEDEEDEEEEEEDENEDEDEDEGEDIQLPAPARPTSINVVDADEDNNAPDAANAEANDEETTQTFEELGLCAPLCRATVGLKWTKPSIIQQQVLPVAFRGRDIIGLAETGSGKTGAFALPILQALLAAPQDLFALILAPTRELAFQISETFEALGAGINLRVVTIVGGVDEMDQARALARRPHIVVATPGRIVHHLENTKGFSMRSLQYFVLDEADRLLNMDFEKEINRVLELIPRERRTFLFSATMTSKVGKLQRASLVDPVKIEVSKKYQTARHLVQEYLLAPAKHKDVYLTYVLNELAGNTAIIFTMTCEQTQKLSLMLRHLGFGAIPLHGKLTQQARLGALGKFKAGQRTILIATDVASRGLDIPAVDLVINYDVPAHSKDYIHRVGRTARAGRSGRAVTLVTQYDIELYQRIEQLLGKKLDQFDMQKEAALVLLERVTEAQRIAGAQLREEAEEEKNRTRKRGGGTAADRGFQIKKTKIRGKK